MCDYLSLKNLETVCGYRRRGEITLKRTLLIIALTLSALPVACKTTDGTNQETDRKPLPPPPVINAQIPLDQALQAAITYGGDTLTQVKKEIKRREQGEAASKIVHDLLQANLQTYDHTQLINAGHLYVAMPVPLSPEFFRELIGSGRVLAQQLGWQLAAVKPSTALAKAIDLELTRALAEGEEDNLMIPQMANAVRANHLYSAYTLMRVGLMTKGDEEFAQAMIHLDPKRASDDFLLYISIPKAEELRQLTLSSINLYTAMAILKHMKSYPPTAGAVGFEHLFYFAVSRNLTLAEEAQTVIEEYIPTNTDLLAALLAKQPSWVQIAYLEAARRHMTPKQGILVGELQKTTAETDVVDEIREMKF